MLGLRRHGIGLRWRDRLGRLMRRCWLTRLRGMLLRGGRRAARRRRRVCLCRRVARRLLEGIIPGDDRLASGSLGRGRRDTGRHHTRTSSQPCGRGELTTTAGQGRIVVVPGLRRLIAAIRRGIAALARKLRVALTLCLFLKLRLLLELCLLFKLRLTLCRLLLGCTLRFLFSFALRFLLCQTLRFLSSQALRFLLASQLLNLSLCLSLNRCLVSFGLALRLSVLRCLVTGGLMTSRVVTSGRRKG